MNRHRGDLFRILFAPREADLTGCCAAWERDPLSHPAIRQMNERQRADLPFEAKCVCSE